MYCPVCVFLLLVTITKPDGISANKLDKSSPTQHRDYSGYGFSQLETTLHCNVVSHWLSPHQEWSLQHHTLTSHVSNERILNGFSNTSAHFNTLELFFNTKCVNVVWDQYTQHVDLGDFLWCGKMSKRCWFKCVKMCSVYTVCSGQRIFVWAIFSRTHFSTCGSVQKSLYSSEKNSAFDKTSSGTFY